MCCRFFFVPRSFRGVSECGGKFFLVIFVGFIKVWGADGVIIYILLIMKGIFLAENFL